MKQVIGIIATKNRPQLLLKALDSALSQSKPLDELIVVSDSDGDAFTEDRRICSCSKDVRFVHDKYARNYAGNLNTAIDFLIREQIDAGTFNPAETYLAFLDDDDSWRTNYVERCRSKLYSNPDFVVPVINYICDEKTCPLDIPEALGRNSFLAKNPHIQGSNTFIRLDTLLRAGCFDEGLNSTTDRDFFTRVMMLDPKYELIPEPMLDVDAHDNRPRLTNDKSGKQASMSYFYSKYYGMMDAKTDLAFFERTKKYTDLPKDRIDSYLPTEETPSYIPVQATNQKGRIVFGFVMSDLSIGRRLLKSIIAQRLSDFSVVVFANTQSSLTEEFKELSSEANAKVVSLKEAVNAIPGMPFSEYIRQSSYRDGQIKDIAVSRMILHYYLKENSSDGDAIWVLDDDMVLETVIRDAGSFKAIPLSVAGITEKYRGKADVVVGSYSGDAPLPTLATIRTSLLDYVYGKFLGKESHYRTDSYSRRDYYYDLADSHLSLECPLPSMAKSIDEVFSGKATSRRLFASDRDDFKAYSRGGNTIIYNRKVLDIPNISPVFDRTVARRSDYFWVEEAEKEGYSVIGASFATNHERMATKFDYKKESDKLLKDLLGASFTKSAEKDLSGTREGFYSSFKEEFESRLVRIVDSLYRVSGLLYVAANHTYSDYFSSDSIRYFVEKAKSYEDKSLCYGAFDFVRDTTRKHEQSKLIPEILKMIKPQYKILGYGGEGVVIRHGKTVTKVFFQPDGLSVLAANSSELGKSEEMFAIAMGKMGRFSTCSYEADDAFNPYVGGHAKAVAELIRFLRKRNLVLTNIKRDNFMLYHGRLKFIDYGKNIGTLTQASYEMEVTRAYEMLHYPDLSIPEFKHLIAMSHMGADVPQKFGIENFSKLIENRGKESIHDGVILGKIRLYHPKTLLDYGAGKCKIANAVSNEIETAVFDIDQESLRENAKKNVTIIPSIDEFDGSFDMAVCNLVLCNVSEEWDDAIVTNLSALVKDGGHVIVSVCDPFFDSVKNTELRSDGYHGEYMDQEAYEKALSNGKKPDFHRPFSYYENLFLRNGFEIVSVEETDGVDVDALEPTGEHLVFDLVNHGLRVMEGCALLIKCCAMDHEYVDTFIKAMVRQLENGQRFERRCVLVDGESGNRNRPYSKDDMNALNAKLSTLQKSGLIDQVIHCYNDAGFERYEKWFGASSNNAYSQNGQQLLTTIKGFDLMPFKYVFQTDLDIIYKIGFGRLYDTFDDFVESGALTGTIGICNGQSKAPSFGDRTEVRTCFLNLSGIMAKLPLKNPLVDGVFSLPWHRALDETMGDDKELSVRYGNHDEEFLHVPNNLKGNPNFIGAVIGAKEWPMAQIGSVDLAGTEKDWSKKSDMALAVFSRGRNVTPSKTKRLIDSFKAQSDQSFQIVYYDDASGSIYSEYLRMLMEYDPWCKSHTIFVSNIRQVGSLANFDRAIHNVITSPNEIVMSVDGDDALCDANAIRTIKNEFRNGADVTIGNVMRMDKPLQTYSVVGFKRSWERDGDNIWIHPKCFLRKLAGNIGGFLKKDGKYIDVHTDYAMMLPIMEAAEHPKLIKEQIYLFDPSSENKLADKQYEAKHRAETKQWLLDEARRVFIKPIAAVIGDARVSPDSETYKMAEAAGKTLADMGYRVQTGGLGGVMEAAMKGAKESSKYEKNGTIAILPGSDEDDANQYADVRIATGEDLMRARKAVDANVVIAIGGGSGTLAEMATAWSTFKLIIAWTGGGWSAKLAGSKIDDRVRYPDVPEDEVYSFASTDEMTSLVMKYSKKYNRIYNGIQRRDKNG